MNRIVFVCLFLSAGIVSAQSQWTWQNPYPQGNNINSIQSVTPDIGYACGDHGTVLKTDSSGRSWESVSFPLEIDLTSLDFVDANDGWVAGTLDSSAYVYQTTDGGDSWNRVLDQKGTWVSINFTDVDTGWMSVDSTLYSYGVGGASRMIRHFPHFVTSICFINKNMGWLAAGDSVYKTTDAGYSWAGSDPADSALQVMDKVVFIDSSIGFATGRSLTFGGLESCIFKSTDGGATWTRQLSVALPTVEGQPITFDEISDIGFAGRNDGWAMAYGTVYRTTDGRNWSKVSYSEYLTALAVVDSSTLWSGGQYGVLHVSTDGGETWGNAYRGFITETNDIHVLNSKDVYVAGGRTILKTTDGGNSWQSMQVDNSDSTYLDIRSVWFTDSLHGWIGVENLGGWGGVYRTTDGGLSWSNQIDNVTRVFSVYFLNRKTGWFFSGDSSYITNDSGKTWSAQVGDRPGLDEADAMEFVSPETGFAGGYLGLYKTTDGGDNWSKIDLGIPDPFVKGIYFIDPQKGWAVGYNGNNGLVLKTTDGGSTWTVANLPQISYTMWPQSVFFQNANDGWVVGTAVPFGFALHTSDGGSSWQQVSLPSSNDLTGVAFSSDTSGWIVGSYGEILHTSNAGVTFVQGNTRDIPKNFVLDQNYPNPFNPTTVISYQLSAVGHVSLKVYDVLGREVATLVDGVEKAGSYRVRFDGLRLASGVYFCRLSAPGYMKTMKMLLLK